MCSDWTYFSASKQDNLETFQSNYSCSSYLPILPRIPGQATAVRRTPSTHHLNMESAGEGEEGRKEGEMMVVRDIRSKVKLVYEPKEVEYSVIITVKTWKKTKVCMILIPLQKTS